MTSILLLMVLIPCFLFCLLFFFYGLFQRSEMLKLPQHAYRNFLITFAVTFVTLIFLLLPIVLIGPWGTFFVSILPIPFTIALVCYLRWRYPRSPGNISTVTLIIVFGILLTCMILISASVYYIQVNAHRNLPKRLPPAVPIPMDYSPRPRPPIVIPATPDSDG